MPKIFKPAGRDKYVVFYTDHNGQRKKKTLTSDKRLSERIANALLEKNTLRKEGFLNEQEEKCVEQEARPLSEHLANYLRVITANGVSFKHVQRVEYNVRHILKQTNSKRISDLSLSAVEEAIGEVRLKRCAGTANFYTRCIKSFSKWLDRDKRARNHILAALAQKDVKGDRRRIRRRLTDAEVAALINAAENGPPAAKGFARHDRAMLYRLAHGTGFRAKELPTLTPERFRLDDDPPTVCVLAGYAKNGKEAEQPIATALADLFRVWLADKPAGKPVFAKMPNRQCAMLRADLERAGVPYITSEGYADFHASKGTYVSNVMDTGASIKTLQTLARHSDPRLTIDVYSKARRFDLVAAVESLPDHSQWSPSSEAVRATGADGATPRPGMQPECYPQTDMHSIERRNLELNNDLCCVSGDQTASFQNSDKASRPEEQAPAVNTAEFHAQITKRIAELQGERQGYWRRILNVMSVSAD
jgi:integrase